MEKNYSQEARGNLAGTSAATTEVTAYLGPELDRDAFVREIARAKLEMEIARQHLDNVDDPLLIDHVIFRLGAAEQRLNYLFQFAKRYDIAVDGVDWSWSEFS